MKPFTKVHFSFKKQGQAYLNMLGYSLIEMMVSIAILGILLAGISSFAAWSIKFTETEANRSRRNVENFEASKMLAQATYFGSLSTYDGNLSLKNCLSADSVICDATKFYDLVLYDTATGKEMKLVSSTDTDRIENKVSFKAHCPNNADTCDKANFFTVNTKTYLKYLNTEFSPIERNIIVEPIVSNVVTFIPDAKISSGRPINALVFIDNSNSMYSAKGQIKAGVEDLISKFSEMDVTLGIYSLVDSYTVTMRDFYIDEFGKEVNLLTKSDFAKTKTYYKEMSYIDNPNLKTYKFKKSDTSVDRETKKLAALAAIDFMFSRPTESKDVPLCNLIRVLKAEKGKSLYSIDKMTPTVVYVISNEDDESTSENCNKSHTAKFDLREYNYWPKTQLQTYDIAVTYMGKMDGVSVQRNSNLKIVNVYDPGFQNTEQYCRQRMVSKHTNIELNLALIGGYKAGSGYTITSCVPNFLDSHKYETPRENTYQASKKICNEFLANYGQMRNYGYANYCEVVQEPLPAGTFTQDLYATTRKSYVGAEGPVPVVYNLLKEVLDTSNFYYVPVVHTNKTTCSFTEGSQVGAEYLKLGKMGGIKSTPIPVCSPSYSEKLNDLTTWTETLGVNDLELPAAVKANMSGIELLKGKDVINVVANVDYSIVGNTLIFRTGLIDANTIIKVYLK